jgi:hypothetical protein
MRPRVMSLVLAPMLAVLPCSAAYAQSTDVLADRTPVTTPPGWTDHLSHGFRGQRSLRHLALGRDGHERGGTGRPAPGGLRATGQRTDPLCRARLRGDRPRHRDPSVAVLSGTPSLESSQFVIDDQLRNAFVNANLSLQGIRCALPDLEPCQSFTADVTVSVMWTGHDKIVPSFYVFRDIGQDFRYVFRTQGTLREATADGSITGDVDLISGATDIAYIARTSNSDILWIRQG